MFCGPSYIKYNEESKIVGGLSNKYFYDASVCSSFSMAIKDDLLKIIDEIINPEGHPVWNLLGVDCIVSDTGIYIIDINNHPGVKGLTGLDLPLDLMYSEFISDVLPDIKKLYHDKSMVLHC
jgi:hypothetical protein